MSRAIWSVFQNPASASATSTLSLTPACSSSCSARSTSRSRVTRSLPPQITSALITTAEEELVDLDLAPQRLAFGRNHRSAQLLQHHPRPLVPGDPELALQLHRRQRSSSAMPLPFTAAVRRSPGGGPRHHVTTTNQDDDDRY